MKYIFNFKFLILCLFAFLVKSAVSQRQYVHSAEQLALTTEISDQIFPTAACQNSDIAFIVHSAAQSSGKYYDKRQAARQTWVKDAKAFNISVTFAIALPRDDTTQEDLLTESETYGDMVQFTGFIDDYYNLTLKAVAVNYWILQNNCSAQFIAKLDDDIFVNVERLVKLKYEIQNGITGHIYGYQTKPIRDPENRYYMPEWAYGKEWYPGYVSGLFYIMTKDIVYQLYVAASIWTDEVLDFDDLYMTGIAGDKIQVQRHRSTYMVFRENTRPDCGIYDIRELNNLIAFHGCDTAEYSINLYNAWKEANSEVEVKCVKCSEFCEV